MRKFFILCVAVLCIAGIPCYAFAGSEPGFVKKETAAPDREKMLETWSKLTEAKQLELYTLKEAADKAQAAVFAKAAELGLIERETADVIARSISERTARLKSNGDMPIFGGKMPRDAKEPGRKR